jgi:hypothetical protein
VTVIAPPVAAIEITDSGYFIFDIDRPEDMRAVGERSGIRTKDDAPLSLGQQECRRWADQFNVRPYRAVVSGTLPGVPGRVWICSGKADNPRLSQLYCRQLGMAYVKNEGSIVTCRLPDRS